MTVTPTTREPAGVPVSVPDASALSARERAYVEITVSPKADPLQYGADLRSFTDGLTVAEVGEMLGTAAWKARDALQGILANMQPREANQLKRIYENAAASNKTPAKPRRSHR